MRIDTNELHPSNGPAFVSENDSLLLDQLQTFGLIEANGNGGWRLTDFCKGELAAFDGNTQLSPDIRPATIRRWQPGKRCDVHPLW